MCSVDKTLTLCCYPAISSTRLQPLQSFCCSLFRMIQVSKTCTRHGQLLSLAKSSASAFPPAFGTVNSDLAMGSQEPIHKHIFTTLHRWKETFLGVPTCVKISCSSQLLGTHLTTLRPVLKCWQPHLLCPHFWVCWRIGQGYLLNVHPLQEAEELPIHTVKYSLERKLLLVLRSLMVNKFTEREELQVLHHRAITSFPILQDTTTTEALYVVSWTHKIKPSLGQIQGRHRWAVWPLGKGPQSSCFVPHAGIEELEVSSPERSLCWYCVRHALVLKENEIIQSSQLASQGQTALTLHYLSYIPPAHPHAYSGNLVLSTTLSLFQNCSLIADPVFVYFAESLLACLKGGDLHFLIPSASLPERCLWEQIVKEESKTYATSCRANPAFSLRSVR